MPYRNTNINSLKFLVQQKALIRKQKMLSKTPLVSIVFKAFLIKFNRDYLYSSKI